MKRLRVFLVNAGLRPAFYPITTPPLGVMYIASYLRSRLDVDIRIADQRLSNCSNEEIVRQAADFEPDVVGLSALTATAHYQRTLSHQIREALPQSLILLGGSHVEAFRAKALEGTAGDAAVPGEAELAFELILRACFDGDGLRDVPGICWRDADNGIITNPGSVPIIDNVDSLPFPAYDLIDLPAYWRGNPTTPIPRLKVVSLFSSRGCPYGCIWCQHVFGKGFRAHSPERVVDEMEYYQRKYGVEDFEFVDDVFNFDGKRVLAICDLIHRRNLRTKIMLPVGVRADTLTEEVIDALVSAGLVFFSCGLESASPRIQKLVGKHLDIERFLVNVELAARRRVFADGFMMLGFPTETEQEIRATIDLACASKLHTGSFYSVTPFPNTKLYDMIKKTNPEKLANIRYEDMDYSRLNVNLSTVPDNVLFHYQRKATRRFYANPSRLMRILRDYPKPHLLPAYAPLLIQRLSKGLLVRHDSPKRGGAQDMPPS